MTAGELHDRLAAVGGHVMVRALAALERAALDWQERAKTVAKNPERAARRDPKSKWLIDTFPTVEDYIAQADLMADYWRAFLSFQALQDYYMRRRAPRSGDYTERFDPDYAERVKTTALTRIEAAIEKLGLGDRRLLPLEVEADHRSRARRRPGSSL